MVAYRMSTAPGAGGPCRESFTARRGERARHVIGAVAPGGRRRNAAHQNTARKRVYHRSIDVVDGERLAVRAHGRRRRGHQPGRNMGTRGSVTSTVISPSPCAGSRTGISLGCRRIRTGAPTVSRWARRPCSTRRAPTGRRWSPPSEPSRQNRLRQARSRPRFGAWGQINPWARRNSLRDDEVTVGRPAQPSPVDWQSLVNHGGWWSSRTEAAAAGTARATVTSPRFFRTPASHPAVRPADRRGGA